MSAYKSGFCQAGNHTYCRGLYSSATELECVCACHRLQGLLARMGVVTAVERLERSESDGVI